MLVNNYMKFYYCKKLFDLYEKNYNKSLIIIFCRLVREIFVF
jgi:hypothetical protein